MGIDRANMINRLPNVVRQEDDATRTPVRRWWPRYRSRRRSENWTDGDRAMRSVPSREAPEAYSRNPGSPSQKKRVSRLHGGMAVSFISRMSETQLRTRSHFAICFTFVQLRSLVQPRVGSFASGGVRKAAGFAFLLHPEMGNRRNMSTQ
ncbi:hypothetical protein MRX96_036437 [Rhipicephalus microplus]